MARVDERRDELVPQCAISRNEARARACHDDAVDHALDPRPPEIALVVVDDHPAIAMAIEATIASEPAEPGRQQIRLLGTARRVADALPLIRGDAPPDVVLCDIQLEAGVDGLQVVAAAHEAGVRAIVLTSFDRSSLMREAFERGASGFLHKAVDVSEILAAVRTVADGGTAFSAATLDAARYAPRPPSAREIEVIAAIQRGATSDEIGARLGISARTVESHVRRLFDRYGVVSRAELAVLAANEGWIEADRG
jgi:DNA-binding NarL/FixJ family response regulator